MLESHFRYFLHDWLPKEYQRVILPNLFAKHLMMLLPSCDLTSYTSGVRYTASILIQSAIRNNLRLWYRHQAKVSFDGFGSSSS
jgi:hypothetical protein